MVEEIYKKIESAIKQSNRILIVGHEKPDGDALGSIFAMSRFVESLEKSYQIFLRGETVFKDMPFLHNVVTEDQIDWNNIDLLISLDSGSLSRSGLADMPDKKILKIDIDHHASNDYFGDINLVDISAPSTTYLVAKMFEFLNFEIDSLTAKALLLGIVTDTDNFSNKATTLDSFEVAANLLKKGANISKLNLSHRDKKIDALRTWGNVFKRLEKNEKYDSAYTVITKEDQVKAEIGGYKDNIEGLANFLNNLKDSKFSMVLKEEDEGVKFSLRTTRDDVDVAKLASFFGGGGHKKAAGFFVKGKLVKGKNGWRLQKS